MSAVDLLNVSDRLDTVRDTVKKSKASQLYRIDQSLVKCFGPRRLHSVRDGRGSGALAGWRPRSTE